MSVLADVLSWAFLLAGAFFTLVGGVGVLRMPDMFSRLHASGITDMLGAGFVMIGLMFQTGGGLPLVKVIMLFAFFALTSPTAAHVLAKCAIHAGIAPKVGPDAGAKAGETPSGEGEPSKR